MTIERRAFLTTIAGGLELFINLNTAKALGLTIPLSLLQRADQVIGQL